MEGHNWQGKITLNFTFYQFALRGMPLLHFLQLLKMMAMMAIFLEMNSKGRVLSYSQTMSSVPVANELMNSLTKK